MHRLSPLTRVMGDRMRVQAVSDGEHRCSALIGDLALTDVRTCCLAIPTTATDVGTSTSPSLRARSPRCCLAGEATPSPTRRRRVRSTGCGDRSGSVTKPLACPSGGRWRRVRHAEVAVHQSCNRMQWANGSPTAYRVISVRPSCSAESSKSFTLSVASGSPWVSTQASGPGRRGCGGPARGLRDPRALR